MGDSTFMSYSFKNTCNHVLTHIRECNSAMFYI